MDMIDKTSMIIWEREFELPIEYECYKDQDVTQEQENALNHFLKQNDLIEKSKDYVKAFCKEQVEEDEENQKKDNIFSYVKPDYIFVERTNNDRKIAIMCRYRYDPEHGIAVIFSENGEISVGSQDVIL